MKGASREASNPVVSEKHHRRRRHRTPSAAKRLLRPQPESTAAYLGFFVLPRSTTDTPHKLHRPRWRWWWREVKTALVVLIIVGGFIGTLGLFFAAVSKHYVPPELLPTDAPWALDTNKNSKPNIR